MLRLEAMDFIDAQMQTRWPDWKPTAEQVADWGVWLSPYDFETARKAVREHVGSSMFNKKPNAQKLRVLLARFQPKREGKVEQPEPTVFVMYEGGGCGPRLEGSFFPIITPPGHNIMNAAERSRVKCETLYGGGTWKVYAETRYAEMVEMRHGFYEMRANAKGKEKKGGDA